MARNQEHNVLVRAALERLAQEGYCAWENETGVWKDEHGRPHHYGKIGSGDIICIIPIQIGDRILGLHCEFEAKTGKSAARQVEKNESKRKSQRLHQKFVVERNGGFYVIFSSVDQLMLEIVACQPYFGGELNKKRF